MKAINTNSSSIPTACTSPSRSGLNRRPRTVDVLFALFAVYGKTFDRALYVRGTSREELIERLPADVESGITSG